jgi:hypothetical protein
MSFEFVIEDGVSIPKREIEFAPRGSQYPFEQMKAGQSFLIPVHGEEGASKKDGTPLTVAEDAKRKAAQKQSYFSSLGKKLGINVVTRFFPEGEDSQSDPSLRVWHNGPRTAEQLAKDAQTTSATSEQGEQGEQAEGADFADDDLNLGDE